MGMMRSGGTGSLAMIVEATTFQALGRPVSSSMSVSYRCTSSQRAESVGASVRWMVAWSFCGLTVMGTSMMEKSSSPGTVSRTRAVTASRVDCCGRRAGGPGRKAAFSFRASSSSFRPFAGASPTAGSKKSPRVQVWSRWTSLSCSHTRSRPRATGRATCRTRRMRVLRCSCDMPMVSRPKSWASSRRGSWTPRACRASETAGMMCWSTTSRATSSPAMLKPSRNSVCGTMRAVSPSPLASS